MEEGVCALPEGLLNEAARAARALRSAGSVLVISHIDADGITAGSIAVETLKRLGKEYRISFEKKITDETIAMADAAPEDIVWICDLGSAYISSFERSGLIITDHHEPDPKWRRGQQSLDQFLIRFHLNPHLYGVDGSYEVCGAGMTYLLSRTVDSANSDLAYLAVIGAVGDFQDDREGRLVSWNRIFLEDAVAEGDISIDTGVRYYGRECRPLAKFLEYGEDPRIPDLSGRREGCEDLLTVLGIETKAGGRLRMWCDLGSDEVEILTGALIAGAGESASRLIGELYSVNRYAPKSGVHDVKEFSTTLNSCGRYDDAPTGSRLCLGDMSALSDVERNRREHKKNISSAISYVRDNGLLKRHGSIQYFDTGDAVRETVVGIVAGMVLNSDIADPEIPIIAFAVADDGVKVSARAPRDAVSAGLNLSQIMHDAAESVGGLGGGHSVAAGATIPEGSKEAFLDAVDRMVTEFGNGRS